MRQHRVVSAIFHHNHPRRFGRRNRLIDPGGVGPQIHTEVVACPDCAAAAESPVVVTRSPAVEPSELPPPASRQSLTPVQRRDLDRFLSGQRRGSLQVGLRDIVIVPNGLELLLDITYGNGTYCCSRPGCLLPLLGSGSSFLALQLQQILHLLQTPMVIVGTHVFYEDGVVFRDHLHMGIEQPRPGEQAFDVYGPEHFVYRGPPEIQLVARRSRFDDD